MSKLSIVPPTGFFGPNWIQENNLPQGISGIISAAGWTYKNEGFAQQTFLGASIRNFSINAGFGDTSSTMSVNLVEDEFNTSDGSDIGQGDDIYHDGKGDKFIPPTVGSPVFFKFGKTLATIEQSWRLLFDKLYNFKTTPDSVSVSFEDQAFPQFLDPNTYVDLETSDKDQQKFTIVKPFLANGLNHLVFGGILQSYIETKGSDGNPLYSVQVVDPREILSNNVLILNNYAGTVFGNKNYLNIYGFLEYDPSDSLLDKFEKQKKRKEILKKTVDASNGNITYNAGVFKEDDRILYVGTDYYEFPPPQIVKEDEDENSVQQISLDELVSQEQQDEDASEKETDNFPRFFPITGQGYSRRGDSGIPWYRVYQALRAMFNYDGFLPEEYADQGFGGIINFRGYNYVIDFSGIPLEKISNMYFLNFEQLDILSLCQELCEVISHDLFVSLLPVIDHPGSKNIFDFNRRKIQDGKSSDIIVGIIRIDAIDRSKPPSIGAVKNYLNKLSTVDKIEIENQDVGYELSNVTTDKIVAGAQEVDIHFFTNNRDRDNLQLRLKNAQIENNFFENLQEDQWLLETSLQQQILPFYGFLGKDVPTIPIGFGAYQQILLDSSNVDAFGVGNYYVATEMELRAALSSYEDWANFLLKYNELYIEEITSDKTFWKNLEPIKAENKKLDGTPYTQEFGVSVPRCLFISDKQNSLPTFAEEFSKEIFGGFDENYYPKNPCAPPYGYPLYYKRAERIGIPQAGILAYQNDYLKIISNYNLSKEISQNKDEFAVLHGQLTSELDLLKNYAKDQNPSPLVQQQITEKTAQLQEINKKIAEAERAGETSVAIRKIIKGNGVNDFIQSINSLSSLSLKNAKKVYDFVRNVAERHLGKTFLVKIPKQSNVLWDSQIKTRTPNFPQINKILYGPFGFKPIPVVNSNKYEVTSSQKQDAIFFEENTPFQHYLTDDKLTGFDFLGGFKYSQGALKCNYNPISDDWEFNYRPEQQGGFFKHEIFDRNYSFTELNFLQSSGSLSKMPLAQRQQLAPIDLTNFQDNSRIKSYVRFDHSEFLDFSSIGKEDVYQQIITTQGFIPDVLEDLNNIDPDPSTSFDQIQKRLQNKDKPPSVAFVRCEVDERFYLLPPVETVRTRVAACKYKKEEVPFPARIEKTTVSGCVQYNIVQDPPLVRFLIEKDDSPPFVERLDFERYYDKETESHIIKTQKQDLNSDYVYAIITLPGRVVPSVDQRYLDGPYQAMNGVDIKRSLTMDVVKCSKCGFDQPVALINNPSGNKPSCDDFSLEAIRAASRAQKDAMKAIGIANPGVQIGYSQPSPVYPDLVALPLMSMERCYGPWVSSSIFNGQTNDGVRYSDIGGKVEFVKDENLAPWNFSGYQLMNEAGALQAQFSNSLLLYTERAGFTMIDDLPTGLFLSKPLDGDNGPLITSISIDVSDSVKTTVKMDLYTSRFGKLQKQKEESIGRIVRERQKINDQNNLITRRGVLKNKSIASSFRKEAIVTANEIEKLATKGISHIVVGQNGAQFMSDDDINKAASVTLDGGPSNFVKNFQQTSSLPLSKLFVAGSEAPDSQLTSREYDRSNYIQRYFQPPPTN